MAPLHLMKHSTVVSLNQSYLYIIDVAPAKSVHLASRMRAGMWSKSRFGQRVNRHFHIHLFFSDRTHSQHYFYPTAFCSSRTKHHSFIRISFFQFKTETSSAPLTTKNKPTPYFSTQTDDMNSTFLMRAARRIPNQSPIRDVRCGGRGVHSITTSFNTSTATGMHKGTRVDNIFKVCLDPRARVFVQIY